MRSPMHDDDERVDPRTPDANAIVFAMEEVRVRLADLECDHVTLVYQIHAGFHEDDSFAGIVFVPCQLQFESVDEPLVGALEQRAFDVVEHDDTGRVFIDLRGRWSKLHLVTAPAEGRDCSFRGVVPVSLDIGEHDDPDPFGFTQTLPYRMHEPTWTLEGTGEIPCKFDGRSIGRVRVEWNARFEMRSWGIKWLDVDARLAALPSDGSAPARAYLESLGRMTESSADLAGLEGVTLQCDLPARGYGVCLQPHTLQIRTCRRPLLDPEHVLASTSLGVTLFGGVWRREFAFEKGDPAAGLDEDGIAAALTETSDPYVASHFVGVLGERGGMAAREALLGVLLDPHEHELVLQNALWGLCELAQGSADSDAWTGRCLPALKRLIHSQRQEYRSQLFGAFLLLDAAEFVKWTRADTGPMGKEARRFMQQHGHASGRQ